MAKTKPALMMAPSQRPMPKMMPASAGHDVMAGPPHTFVQTDPKNNTPRALLRRPGLGLGTGL